MRSLRHTPWTPDSKTPLVRYSAAEPGNSPTRIVERQIGFGPISPTEKRMIQKLPIRKPVAHFSGHVVDTSWQPSGISLPEFYFPYDLMIRMVALSNELAGR